MPRRGELRACHVWRYRGAATLSGRSRHRRALPRRDYPLGDPRRASRPPTRPASSTKGRNSEGRAGDRLVRAVDPCRTRTSTVRSSPHDHALEQKRDSVEDALARAATSAVAALRGPAWPVARVEAVQPVPGLYAVHGDEGTWRELGLGDPPDARPLYVGKAEKSLVSRDLETHFGRPKAGREQSITGSSTLRRSVAGLLAPGEGYRGVPRNPERPGHFANFGLSREQDERLADWMAAHLRLAVWPKQGEIALDQVETLVLRAFMPPLNLDKVVQPWRGQVKAARGTLAQQAREA